MSPSSSSSSLFAEEISLRHKRRRDLQI